MITLPFTFVTDTTIQAPQVNDNFIALRDGVNAIPPGTQGPPGLAATIHVGSVTSTAHTNPPSITEAVGSTAQARIYNFVIPEGAPGDPGDITAAVNTAVANAITALLATLDERYVRIGS